MSGDVDVVDSQRVVVQDRLEIARFKEKTEYNRLIRWGWGAIALLSMAIVAAFQLTESLARYVPLVLFLLSLSCSAVAWVKRNRVTNLRSLMRTLELELDLLRFGATNEEHRAKKLLNINQFEMRQYYTQALAQGSWVFGLGVACVLVGVGVIAVTFYILTHQPELNTPNEIAVSIVGAIGAILSNFVAVVYLRMQSAATANLTGLHGRLVGAHSLFFANVLASRLPLDARNRVLERMVFATLQIGSGQPIQTVENSAPVDAPPGGG